MLWLEVHLLKFHVRSDKLGYSVAYAVSSPLLGADYFPRISFDRRGFHLGLGLTGDKHFAKTALVFPRNDGCHVRQFSSEQCRPPSERLVVAMAV
jgi:hypothetical protein